MWEFNAQIVEIVYGMQVDWDERFYICPACGEPIYECDWNDDVLDDFICPVCEFIDEDYEDD